MVTNSALQLSVLQLLQKMRLSLAFVETRQKSWSSYPIFFFFQIQSSTVRISYRKFSKEFTLLFPIYPIMYRTNGDEIIFSKMKT